MNPDIYKTIAKPSEGLYKDKGSRFLSYTFPVSQEQEIKDIVVQLKKEHHSARHHCFAWRLGINAESFRTNDDGEPSGTAGRPILGQIQSKGVTNILVVVVRYFGGTLLGVSGLINAYKQAAQSALENAEIVEKIVEEIIEVQFSYATMNDIMQLIKEMQLEMVSSDFGLVCKICISVRMSLIDLFLNKLNKIDGIIKIESTENK
jgi:uncharacterized YigZ family protein